MHICQEGEKHLMKPAPKTVQKTQSKRSKGKTQNDSEAPTHHIPAEQQTTPPNKTNKTEDMLRANHILTEGQEKKLDDDESDST